MLRHTTQPNRGRMALAQIDGVHAMTDVTGSAWRGILLEICRGSAVVCSHRFGEPALPVPWRAKRALPPEHQAATGPPARASAWPETAPNGSANLLTDPQTSGGIW